MNIIDLFSGCGGFSLGFELAGFKTVCAIEKDLWAAETYSHNHPDTNVIQEGIETIPSPKTLVGHQGIDGIVGGPPCQGFSLSGNRDPKDPRNSLFSEFVRFTNQLQPKFFVMENVCGLLSMQTKSGELVPDIILNEFEGIGYNAAIYTLCAEKFGVPQMRKRIFFIGVREDLTFNYDQLQPISICSSGSFVSLNSAISDLPQIQSGEGEVVQEYPCPPKSKYQKWARKGSPTIQNHVAMRHTQRIIERFQIIGFGQSLANAPKDHMQRKRGNAEEISGKTFSQNNMRPFPDKPCPTIAASFQSNFIHPNLNRNFTAREAARIQSFPDSYIFKGKRTTMSWEKHLSQYQQIGNAVPPLLAKAIAENLSRYFREIDSMKESLSPEKQQIYMEFK